jgi:hypothetical protein
MFTPDWPVIVESSESQTGVIAHRERGKKSRKRRIDALIVCSVFFIIVHLLVHVRQKRS